MTLFKISQWSRRWRSQLSCWCSWAPNGARLVVRRVLGISSNCFLPIRKIPLLCRLQSNIRSLTSLVYIYFLKYQWYSHKELLDGSVKGWAVTIIFPRFGTFFATLFATIQNRNFNQLSVDYGWDFFQSQWLLFDLPFHGLLGTLQKEKMRSNNLKDKINHLDTIMPKVVKAFSTFYNYSGIFLHHHR